MAGLPRAAMLLSFDIATETQTEHDDWHSHEHLPERLSIPGFLRGSRPARVGVNFKSKRHAEGCERDLHAGRQALINEILETFKDRLRFLARNQAE